MKLLANKYAEKLDALQEQHKLEMQELEMRVNMSGDYKMNPGDEEVNVAYEMSEEDKLKIEELEQSVVQYVEMVHGREKELNGQIKSLARLVKRQTQYIQVMKEKKEKRKNNRSSVKPKQIIFVVSVLWRQKI
jgi:hypothetical protein